MPPPITPVINHQPIYAPSGAPKETLPVEPTNDTTSTSSEPTAARRLRVRRRLLAQFARRNPLRFLWIALMTHLGLWAEAHEVTCYRRNHPGASQADAELACALDRAFRAMTEADVPALCAVNRLGSLTWAPAGPEASPEPPAEVFDLDRHRLQRDGGEV